MYLCAWWKLLVTKLDEFALSKLALLTINHDLIQWEVALNSLIITSTWDDMRNFARRKCRRCPYLSYRICCSLIGHRGISQTGIGQCGVCHCGSCHC